MNKLSINRQAQIIKALCEGNSIRSTARITDTAINTVVKLLRDVGLSNKRILGAAFRLDRYRRAYVTQFFRSHIELAGKVTEL